MKAPEIKKSRKSYLYYFSLFAHHKFVIANRYPPLSFPLKILMTRIIVQLPGTQGV
jgi:hypothetical protein